MIFGKEIGQLTELMEDVVGPAAGFGVAIAIVAIFIILVLTIVPAIVGWLIVTFIGFFTPVAISGYFTYALIGFVAIVIVQILR